MLLADARALLPGLTVRDAAPADDAVALAKLADWCGRYSPWVTVDGADGVLADLTGCAHLFGGEAALLADLRARLTDFAITARAAIAETPAAAWALARFAAEREACVPAGATEPTLALLPVAALRLPAETVAGLSRLGLQRIGELAKIPRAALAARFGRGVRDRLDRAFGRVDEPVSPRRPAPKYLSRMAFPEPIGNAADIAAAAAHLAGDLCAILARDGQGARRVELALYLADGRVHRIALGLSRPSREARHLLWLLEDRLRGLEAGVGADVIAFYATVAEPLAAEQVAMIDTGSGAAAAERDGRSAGFLADPELGLLIDRLGNRLGLINVARLAPQLSHLPERAVRVVAPLAPPQGAWDRETPRPVSLLACPEPVEAVAEVPDNPPVLFRWRGQVHRIARADGPERLAPEWWREGAPTASATRDYYRLEDEAGRRFWLYREGLYDAEREPRWYLHGFFA